MWWHTTSWTAKISVSVKSEVHWKCFCFCLKKSWSETRLLRTTGLEQTEKTRHWNNQEIRERKNWTANIFRIVVYVKRRMQSFSIWIISIGRYYMKKKHTLNWEKQGRNFIKYLMYLDAIEGGSEAIHQPGKGTHPRSGQELFRRDGAVQSTDF